MRTASIPIFLAGAALVAGGCQRTPVEIPGEVPDPGLTRDLGSPVVVEILGVKSPYYTPRVVEVRVGQAVKFENRDPVVHTVTADDQSWDSSNLGKDGVWTTTFERTGTFPYYCRPHPWMTGTISVVDDKSIAP